MKCYLGMLTAIVIMSGCSDTASSTTPEATDTGVSAVTDATTPTPTSSTINVAVGANGGLAFSPASVTISQGDTVHWVWNDPTMAHTVTSGAPGSPDGNFCSITDGSPVNAATCNSLSYARTAPFTYDHIFSQAGSFPYYCTVHGAAMTGTVVVNPGRTTTATPSPPPTPQPY